MGLRAFGGTLNMVLVAHATTINTHRALEFHMFESAWNWPGSPLWVSTPLGVPAPLGVSAPLGVPKSTLSNQSTAYTSSSPPSMGVFLPSV